MKQVRIRRTKIKRTLEPVTTGHNIHECVLSPSGRCLITHKEK